MNHIDDSSSSPARAASEGFGLAPQRPVFMIVLAVLHFVALSLFSASSAVGAELAGHWKGEATFQGETVPVAFDFNVAEADSTPSATKLQGTLDLPDAGVLGRPLRAIELTRNALSFEVFTTPPTPGEGTLEGDTLRGHWGPVGNRIQFSVQRTPDDRPYTLEEVVFSQGDIRLAGSLAVPHGEGPHPAIVLMHGSGDFERWHHAFYQDFYARLGFAALIFDKRGCGRSTGNWRDVGFEPLAADGVAAVHHLQSRDEIDPDRIGMWGISQAGWIMPMAASISDDVAFLVVTSGGPVRVEEEGLYDQAWDLRRAGYSEIDIARAIKLRLLDNEVTRSGQHYEEALAYWRSVRTEPWFKELGFFFVTPPSNPRRDFYRRIMDIDHVPIVAGLEIPVLWLYGSNDDSFSPYHVMRVLNEIIEEHDNEFTVKLFPYADHGLRVTSTTPLPGPRRRRHFADGYLETIETWLKAEGFMP